MDDVRARLIRCFEAVFPKLKEQEIPAATLDSIEEWDSIATVTLLAVVEEEFGVHFEFEAEDLRHLASFESILDHLEKREGLV